MVMDTNSEVGAEQSTPGWKTTNNLLAWANSPSLPASKQWNKGKHNGQAGRPKKTQADYMLTERCREHSEEAMATILEIMRDVGQEGAVRLKAAQTILDRGFGKAVQQTQLTNVDGDGNTLDMNHTIVFVAAQPKCINPD